MLKATDFADLKLERVIDKSDLTKYITFKGTLKGQTALIRLEKTPFDEKDIMDCVNNRKLGDESSLVRDDDGSVIQQFVSTNKISDLTGMIMAPADEEALKKHSRDNTILFYEEPRLYYQVVANFVKFLSEQKEQNEWIYNILDGKSEKDTILFRDPHPTKGFVLVDRCKLSDKSIKYLALVNRRDVHSLRDLDGSHLTMLQNILVAGHEAINQKYNDHEGQVRSYVHYHPNFYHFHVYFEMIDAYEYKTSDRDHMLSTVIGNITIANDYYKKTELIFPLAESSVIRQLIFHQVVGSPYPRMFGPASYRNRRC